MLYTVHLAPAYQGQQEQLTGFLGIKIPKVLLVMPCLNIWLHVYVPNHNTFYKKPKLLKKKKVLRTKLFIV